MPYPVNPLNSLTSSFNLRPSLYRAPARGFWKTHRSLGQATTLASACTFDSFCWATSRCHPWHWTAGDGEWVEERAVDFVSWGLLRLVLSLASVCVTPYGPQIAMAGTQTREPEPQGATGDSRGKSNSGAPYGPQITMAGTQTREPALEGGQPATAATRATAQPLISPKSPWQGHAQESRRPKWGNRRQRRGKSNIYGPQITMAGTRATEPAPQVGQPVTQPRQEQQRSHLWTPNQHGRDMRKRAGGRRAQPATAAATATGEPLMDHKSQWQGLAQESRYWMCDVGCVMSGVRCWVCDVECVILSVWCRVCDVGCGMLSVWCRVCDIKCVMLGVWCWVCDVGCVILSVWCWVCDVGCVMLGVWYWVCYFKCVMLSVWCWVRDIDMCDIGCVMLSVWCWVCDIGCVMLGVWCWVCDVECVMLSVWYWVCDVECVMLGVWCWVCVVGCVWCCSQPSVFYPNA